MSDSFNLAVGADGGGTTLQALIDACETGVLNARIAVVFGNRAEAGAFRRAAGRAIPTVTLRRQDYASPEALTAAFRAFLRPHQVDLICLAGFLKQLPPAIIREYEWRIINSHPALLPFFGGHGWYGHHVHEAVLASGMKVGGCTIHFVTEEYDQGPIIIQRAIPIEEDDTPDTFAARLLPHEHECYIEAVRLIVEGRADVVDPPDWAASAKVWNGSSGRRKHVRFRP